ncbi:MAG: M48 family metallopeptidase [Robiginitomaculum sp.]|nr:M48 family metallopeptidase [Robiginitomaculum sp.]
MAQFSENLYIPGRYFKNQSSTATDCTLIIDEENVHIESRDGRYKSHHCQRRELVIDRKIAKIARKIHLPDGIVFEANDPDVVDRLRPHSLWATLSNTERFGWHLLPLAIITPFLAYALYKLLIPLVISLALILTPDGLLKTIDKNSVKSIDLVLTDTSKIDEGRQVELTQLFNSLLLARQKLSPKRKYNYQLLFRSSKILGPNAFALPGGTIVLTDELVEDFSDDYILAAVLAHEIGHVENQHSLKQLYRALGIAAMVTLIAGDAGPLLEDAILEGSAVLSLSFSRQHELQADDYSFDLLVSAGRRPDGLIDFFEQLSEDMPMPKEGEWLMTHPLSQKRIANIKNKMEARP